ncbi:MAG TPA: nuclear transport factor 2 family protein [Blastocatellia bacterium]|nr:nuclear transport factor 2 family protein [Blastocatellia bacterium]
MNAITPVEVFASFIDRINAHDVDALSEMMTDDHLFVDSLGRSSRGREAMKEAWDAYFRLFPDYAIACEETIGRAELVVGIGAARGTYSAAGLLFPDNSWEIPAAWKAIVEDGRVAEWRVYADNDPVRRIIASPKK